MALGVELLSLGEGVSGGANQAKFLLALAEFQPEQEMSGIQLDGLLQSGAKFAESVLVLAAHRQCRSRRKRGPLSRPEGASSAVALWNANCNSIDLP